MSLRNLRTLVAIADHGSFAAASKAVHVTHAAVSQQIKALEREFGLTLFDRQARPPKLTQIGKQVVDRARSLIEAYDTLVPSVLGDDGLSGALRLGALRTTLTGLAPRALAHLQSWYPALALHIRPGLTQELIVELERDTLDAALITQPHVLPSSLAFQALAQEPLHLIVAADEGDDDPIGLITSRPYIRFNRHAVVGTLIENWLNARALRVQETMELDSLEAIESMVGAKLGVSIVPKPRLVTQPNPDIVSLSLGPDAPYRTLGLAYRHDQWKTRAIEEVFRAFEVARDTRA